MFHAEKLKTGEKSKKFAVLEVSTYGIKGSVSFHIGANLKTNIFFAIFLQFFCNFFAFLTFRREKHQKAYFDQHLKCPAHKRWLKNTTNDKQC